MVMRYVSQKRIEDAKKALNRGDVLAVPTENFYGLTVKLDNTAAIRKLLDIKNRQIDSAKILTLLVADVDDIKKYASIDRKTLNMARHYFPGELTLILPKHRTLKHPYFDHFETVGVRIPEHKYLLELIRTTGPLLAIGATPHGEAPCRSGKHVAEVFPKVDSIVEGESDGNIPPTVIDWTESEPMPIRQGGLLIVRYA